MKYLSESSDKPGKKIEITKLITITLQCSSCDKLSDMQGGPIMGDKPQAVFECTECGYINKIDWRIDF